MNWILIGRFFFNRVWNFLCFISVLLICMWTTYWLWGTNCCIWEGCPPVPSDKLSINWPTSHTWLDKENSKNFLNYFVAKSKSAQALKCLITGGLLNVMNLRYGHAHCGRWAERKELHALWTSRTRGSRNARWQLGVTWG